MSAWIPSEKEQRLLWYLQLVLRYMVGGGGMAWELVIDQGKNPLVLLTCAVLASSADVFRFVRQLTAMARQEQEELERTLEEERRLNRLPKGDDK